MSQILFNILIVCCIVSLAIPVSVMWDKIKRGGRL